MTYPSYMRKEAGIHSHQLLKHSEGGTKHTVSLNLQARTPKEQINQWINSQFVSPSQKKPNWREKIQKDI